MTSQRVAADGTDGLWRFDPAIEAWVEMAVASGNVSVFDSFEMRSPDGTLFVFTVDNAGALTTTGTEVDVRATTGGDVRFTTSGDRRVPAGV